jgi:DNA-binding beta-propeller fold protein YncE
MDLIESACDAKRRRVFATEFFGGGVWEVPLDGTEPRRHAIGGVLLVAEWRFDDRLVLADSSSLVVFNPDEGRVLERVPARLGGHGFDVCPSTGAAAVADLAGRLRVFELDPSGHYRFAWGVSAFAPRRVAYSSDCSRIGVTSADDHRVYVIDAAEHRVVDVFHAGPALRDVAPTGPREFSVSDVCSLTTFRW